MNELALFAGAGGGILGGKLLGWTTVCAVEWEAYPASVLIARQNEGVLPHFPIWDDVRTFDGRPWRGRVDVVSGGFPCQDISAAGKGAGIDGERSGMWAHMARIVREVGPRYVFVENSPMLTSRGLGRVLGDLAAMGYDARWGVLGAVDAGAPHKRDRIWILAYAAGREDDGKRGASNSERRAVERHWKAALGANRQTSNDRANGCSEDMAHSHGLRELQPQGAERTERRWSGDGGQAVADADLPHGKGVRRTERSEPQRAEFNKPCPWWRHDPADQAKSGVGRMADGIPARVDRLKAIGNGQVPIVAALAWRILSK